MTTLSEKVSVVYILNLRCSNYSNCSSKMIMTDVVGLYIAYCEWSGKNALYTGVRRDLYL